jgi:hypothetical protein
MTATTPSETLRLVPTRTVAEFVKAVAYGTKPEVVVFGPRGEGKTWGALIAMIAHAERHHAAGHPLPVKWLGVTGTFESHKSKTHDTLRAPGWRGCWTLSDQGHVATFAVHGTRLVDLRLFGAGDHDGLNRLRTEAHCMWFEESAPAAELGALGMTENHWGMGRSSLRLGTHATVARSTSNYPDEDFWSWQRWMAKKRADAVVFEIPALERVTKAQQAVMAEGITDPVMRRRLLEGLPGTLIPGRPVADGFNEKVHVSREPLVPVEGRRLYIGQDGGLQPASVIADRDGRRIRILAALTSKQSGMVQHVRYTLIPWLGEHAPWVLNRPELIRVRYDQAMDTASQDDVTTNPVRSMQHLLPGSYAPSQNVPFAWRRDPLLVALASLDEGQPLVTVDPGAGLLIRAWRGMWHYAVHYDGSVRKEEPKKPCPPWADIGDASAYVIADMAPLALEAPAKPRGPRAYARDGKGRAKLLGMI